MSAPINPSERQPFPGRLGRGFSGFTLLELLVATVVTLLFAGMLLALLDGASRIWHQTEARTTACRDLRAALAILANDLRNGATSPDSRGRIPFFLDPPGVLPATAQTDSALANSLFFLSAQPSSTTASIQSDLCQVGYFLAYDSFEPDEQKTWNLYRYFRGGEATLQDLRKETLFRQAATGALGEEILARNVIEFHVAAYQTNRLGQFEPYDRSPHTLPCLITLSVTTVDATAGKALLNLQDGYAPNTSVIQRALRKYQTRIALTP